MANRGQGGRIISSFIRRVCPESILVHLHAADHNLNGEPEIRLLRHLCDSSKISLDIGANIGTYTYFMRRHSRAVIAYEPNPKLAKRLERLFRDVTVCHAAASDVPGELSLRIPVEDGREQHELASVAQDFESSQDVVEFTVKAMPIDDEGLKNVGFIKIDAEQYELPVLAGCPKTIEACRPAILTEVTPLLYPRPIPETFKFLTQLGYDRVAQVRPEIRLARRLLATGARQPRAMGRSFHGKQHDISAQGIRHRFSIAVFAIITRSLARMF